MMRRRHIRVAAFLILGAIINLFIAWSIGLLVSPSWLSSNYNVEGDGWPSDPPADWPHADRWSTMSGFGFDSRGASANLKELVEKGNQDSSFTYYHMDFYKYGWPARSVACRRLVTQQGPQVKEFGESPLIRGFEANLFGYHTPYQRIALRPLLLGFMINTLFYAALASATFCLARTMGRRVRDRKGMCPICGYNLTDLVDCPECGNAVPTDSTT